MDDKTNGTTNGERGVALITALLATTLILALGLAVAFSTTNDTQTTKSQRVGEQAFFTADAGIGIARRALAQALSEEIDKLRSGVTPFYRNNPPASPGQFPDIQLVPDPDSVDGRNSTFYRNVTTRANQLCRVTSRDQRFSDLNGSSFATTFSPMSGNVSLVTSSATSATQVLVLKYAIQVTGRTAAGGKAVVNEVGRLSANINLQAGPSSTGYRDFSFSGFGAFFDNGDPDINAVLVPGTFSGAVHTNTHFAFYSKWQYTFRNAVSQVDPKIRYWTNTNNNYINIPTSNIPGITLSPEGYKQVGTVPLPSNVFSQEYAVINGTGITDRNPDGTPVDAPPVIPKDSKGNPIDVFDASGRVAPQVLAANLRTASNTQPSVQGNSLANGVYVSSSDGTNVDGAGIYVQGDATDIQLYALNGAQYYVIQQKQGNTTTTTTVRVNYDTNQTTVTSGSQSVTYNGVFTDKQDPSRTRPGASLFVNGTINSLRGGKDSSNNRPAIASQTALTVTATRHIFVTGDLKYTDPVVNSDGTPVSNIKSVQNVLGLFTNDGNVFLDAKSNYVSGPGLSIETNAAMAVFDSNTSNNGGKSEGGVTSYTGSGHQKPGSNDRIRMVGSDVEKNNSLVDYNYGDTYFDVRFSGGVFRPPFFPGTSYSLGPPPVAGFVTIASVDAPASTAMSWFRDSN